MHIYWSWILCTAHLSKSRRCPSRKGIGRKEKKWAAIGSSSGSSSSQDLFEVGKYFWLVSLSYQIECIWVRCQLLILGTNIWVIRNPFWEIEKLKLYKIKGHLLIFKATLKLIIQPHGMDFCWENYKLLQALVCSWRLPVTTDD